MSSSYGLELDAALNYAKSTLQHLVWLNIHKGLDTLEAQQAAIYLIDTIEEVEQNERARSHDS